MRWGPLAMCFLQPLSLGRCPSLFPSVLRSCNSQPRGGNFCLAFTFSGKSSCTGSAHAAVENTPPPSKHQGSGATVKTSEESCDAEGAGLLRGAGSCRPSLGGTLRKLPRRDIFDLTALPCVVWFVMHFPRIQTKGSAGRAGGAEGRKSFPTKAFFSSELGYPSKKGISLPRKENVVFCCKPA